MKSGRLVAAAITLAASSWIMAVPAQASTRGYDTSGNPWTGLLITILILLAVIAFALAYMCMDRLEQRRIDVKKKRGDIDGLIKALRVPWLSTKAARALGEIGDERAIEPLIQALSCRSAETREAVVDALGNIGDQRAVEKLNAALDDRYVSVREHARSSIEKIRSRAHPAGNGNAGA
ncbi:HEAT repeat domain-containing protein [Methanocella arvoryzae]|uniref:HEAT repeat domain-containing protein n=1 Tax=Methanocella arvoryzae (strain DSM 22066 / NBRC 105507 / MRE50) TaxID=351160 RepID=Q0W5U5_METAR|nr:HEAT repeat domain-containing protein [Methanocella arvoryzae]CAJ36248.1 hypothetical protein RCIX898 [Methanocella arvoryzae MRE50]